MSQVLLAHLRNAFPTGFRTVIFDCDSTLSAVEGIDELGRSFGAVIRVLTDAAMRGEIALEDVYGRRLDLVQPTRDQLDAVGRLYVERMVEDAREVCAELAGAGVEVRIMSGGLRPAVLQLAAALGVPDQNVAAVDISFHPDGRYESFDSTSPLARSGGKLEMLKSWLPALQRPIMVVGDGATDLETRPVADIFVAYAGVVARDNVLKEADFVVRSASLAPVFTLATTADTVLTQAGNRLRAKGAALLDELED